MPVDLSCWQSVTNLNLTNIMLEDFEAAVHSLATMPCLKSLYINLHDEDQVDVIMKNLPILEFLNNLEVERDGEEEPSETIVEEDEGEPESIDEIDQGIDPNSITREAEMNGPDQIEEQENEEDSMIDANDETAQPVSRNSAPRRVSLLTESFIATEDLESMATAFDAIRGLRRE